MKKLVVDMDGVLADIYEQFLSFEEREFGIRQNREDVVGKTESEAFKNEKKYALTPSFFRNAPLITDSRRVVEKLNKEYDLYIVSAATEFPQSLLEKQEWLNEFFPFITWKQMVFCGSKKLICGDIMIDDHYKNLDYFNGTTLLFTQPHNQLLDEKWHTRVNSWKEIEKMLL